MKSQLTTWLKGWRTSTKTPGLRQLSLRPVRHCLISGHTWIFVIQIVFYFDFRLELTVTNVLTRASLWVSRDIPTRLRLFLPEQFKPLESSLVFYWKELTVSRLPSLKLIFVLIRVEEIRVKGLNIWSKLKHWNKRVDCSGLDLESISSQYLVCLDVGSNET
jgi:hypothetical protein